MRRTHQKHFTYSRKCKKGEIETEMEMEAVEVELEVKMEKIRAILL